MVANTTRLRNDQEGRSKLLYQAYVCICNVPPYSVLLKKICSGNIGEVLQEYQAIFIMFYY
jgi:hypothetical protein